MAFSLRKNNDGGTVGLDIDGRFLAAAEVRNGKLANIASVELPSGALRDGEVVDRAGLAAAIKEFVGEHKLPRRVQLGVSNQQIVVRVLELPQIEDVSERDAAIRFQAAEAIAMPLDEAVLDHQVAGYVDGPDGSTRMQVVVVAARRSMIDEYLGAAADAGLKVEGIDLDAFALVRMLADEAPATFPVPAYEPPAYEAPTEPLNEEHVPYIGDEPTVEPLDEQPTEPIADAGEPSPYLSPVPDDAAPTESLAPTEPLAPEPYAPPTEPLPEPVPDPDAPPSARVICHLGGVSNLAIAVGSSCFFTRTLSTRFDDDNAGARLADEIRLSIDYYMAQPAALAVTDVLVSGEGARDAALVAEVSAQLGMPVGAARPLGGLDNSTMSPDEDPYRYTVAAGLALGAAA